jgi:hypothetical protein
MLTVSCKGAVYVFRCKGKIYSSTNDHYVTCWVKTAIKLTAWRKLLDKDLHRFRF